MSTSPALLVGSEKFPLRVTSWPANLWPARRHRLVAPALSAVLLAVLVAAWNAPAAHAQAANTTADAVYGQLGSFTTNTVGGSANSLANPSGVAVDSSGGLYVADYDNNRVLYYPAGSTTATQVYGQSSLGSNNAGVGANGLNAPAGVALDSSGGLYVADSGNNRVLYYLSGSTTASLVYGQSTFASSAAGTGITSLRTPFGVAVDSSGNLYVADSFNSRVLFYPSGSTNGAPASRVYGGSGGVTASTLSVPTGVAVDSSGNLYVSDGGNNRVLFYPSGNTTPTQVYGQSSFTTATAGTSATSLNAPYAVAVDSSGNLYVADLGNNRVLFYPSGSTTATQVYGQGGSFTSSTANNGGVSASSLNEPIAAAVDSSGNLYVADFENNRVLVYPQPDFGNVNVCPTGQTTPDPCNKTQTLTFTIPAGTTIGSVSILITGAPNLDFQAQANDTSTTLCTPEAYYASAATCTVDVTFAPLAPGERMGAVQIYDDSTPANLLAQTLIYGTGVGPAIAFSPSNIVPLGSGYNTDGVAVDAAGDVFVGGAAAKEIVAVNGSIPATNPTIRTLGSGFEGLYGVAVDAAGDVFFVNLGSTVKEIVAVNGSIPATNPTIRTLGSGFEGLYGVAVDAAGDVFVTDFPNNAVKEIVAVNGSIPATNPTIRTLGSGFSFPIGVAVDAAGDVFVGDQGNRDVKEIVAVNGSIPASPTIRTLGSGFMHPTGVAVDAAGDVFVTDPAKDDVKEIVAVNGSIPATNPTILTLGSGYDDLGLVTVDAAGDVFFANTTVQEIVRSQPPAFSFASTAVGSTSTDSPQSTQIQNIGNQPLEAVEPGLQVAGPNFLQVPGSGTPADCTSGFALAPGAECNLSLSFTPQAGGPLTGTAVFTDNALNAYPSASQSIGLSGTGTNASQTITFTTNAPANATYGSQFTVAASGGASGNPVTFSTTPSGACTNVGATYTMTSGAGTCTVLADQAGNADYAAAPEVTQSVTATQVPQTITFTISPPASAVFNSSFTVAANATSGLAVTFTASGACTNVGATYTMTSGAGTCTVLADQAGDANNAPAPEVTQTVAAAVATANVCPAGLTTPAPCSQTFTVSFNIPAGTTIGAINILTTGATNLDFQAEANDTSTTLCTPGPYASATTCTVDVTFTPIAPGERMGAVQIYDQNNHLLASTLIYGIGQAPAIAFSPSNTSTLGSGFISAAGVAVDAAGDVFVADNSNNNEVSELVAVNGSITATPTVLGSGFFRPSGVAVDAAGDVFVGDTLNQEVKEILAVNGSIPANATPIVLATGFGEPFGVAVDVAGDVFVADRENQEVKEILAVNGSIPANPTIRVLGSGFGVPTGVAVDVAGDVFVADYLHHAVYELLAVNGSIPTTNPTIRTLGSGFSFTSGVAVDAAGDVFVADSGNNQVKEMVAVNGSIPATNPTILILGSGYNNLSGVAVDAAGDLFVAAGTVQEIVRSQPPAFSFASTAVGSTSSDSPKSMHIQNIGNQPLDAVTPGLVIGPNFLQVPGSGTPADCTSSFALTPGASCNLSLSFTPQAGGALTSTAVFTDNTFNVSAAIQTIALSGTGLPATPTVTWPAASAITYGQSLASSNLTGGSAVSGSTSVSGTFAFTNPATVPAAGAQLESVTFTPTNLTAYNSVTSTVSVQVNQAPQTITFSINAPANAAYGSQFTVAASATSNLAVTFTSSGVCTNVGAAYTMTSGTGTCMVIVDQAGNADYAAAPEVIQSVTATQAPQTISFAAIPPLTVGAGPIPLSVTGGASGNPVNFILSGPNQNLFSIKNSTLTILGAGTATVTAFQAGNANYLAATPVMQTIVAAVATANVCPSSQTTPAPCSQTFTVAFNIPANTTIGSVKILTTGIPNLDFQAETSDTSTTLCAPGTYASATTCTVDVTFAPLAPGARNGAVQLLGGFVSGVQSIVASTPIHGVGQGPAIAFPGIQITPFLSSLNGFTSSSFSGVAVNAKGDVFMTKTSGGPVVKIPAGCMTSACQTTASGNLTTGSLAVAVDGAGDLFVGQGPTTYQGQSTASVVMVTPSGAQTTVISGLTVVTGVAVDGAGDLFVADSNNSQVVEVPAGCVSSACHTTFGTGVFLPQGVAVDAAGDLFILNGGFEHGVVEVPAGGGAQTTVATNFQYPNGFAVDAAGDLFISANVAPFSNTLLEVPAGCASSACQIAIPNHLFSVRGIAVDGTGNLFIADTGQTIVAMIQRSQPPAFTFASTAVGSTSTDSPQSTQIQNIGNAALTGSGVLNDTTDFTQATGPGIFPDCTLGAISLAPGAECNLSLSFNPQSVGPLTTTAAFTDNTLNANAAPQNTQTITLSGTALISTMTALAASPSPSTTSQPVTFTATVTASSGPTPTGTVTFYSDSGNTLMGSAPLNSGVATYTTTSPLSVTTHHILAEYSGNATDAASHSLVLQQMVSSNATITKLTSTGPSTSGEPVTFTATVRASIGPAPTGMVNFYSGGGTALMGPGTLSGGMATYTTSSLSVATHNIVAKYLGTSGTDAASQSAVLTQVVSPSPTTTELTSTGPSSSGQQVTFTATVAASPSSGTAPTGSVGFYSASGLLGTMPLSGGVANYSTSSLSVATHHIVAKYLGSVTDTASESPVLMQVVNPSATATELTSTGPSTSGQSVTFTATVTASSGSTPTGTVNFYSGSGSTFIGSGTLSGGVATCTTSSLSDATHHIVAKYLGSGTDAASESPALLQVVTE